MKLPEFVSALTLNNFRRLKTPLYPGIVDEYWIQAPLHNIRADYALFHCLWYTNFFRARVPLNDFGGGAASDTASGVDLALKKLEALNGDWLQLPAEEYEGIKKIEEEFLLYVGVKKPEPKPVPKPVPAPEPVPEPVPEPQKPVASKGGFWSFIRTIAGILAGINGFLWLLKMFIPAPIVSILQVVIKFITELAAAHPGAAVAGFVSTVVATHAVALKINPPKTWQRPDRSAL